MKRCTGEEERAAVSTSAAAAETLVLFPCAKMPKSESGSSGAFECRTCRRTFPTLQALGGHCTGHQRARAPAPAPAKAGRVHGCPLCGKRFAVGQALGGHMRRHRNAAAELMAEGGGLCLELSLSPPGTGGAGDHRELFGLRPGLIGDGLRVSATAD